MSIPPPAVAAVQIRAALLADLAGVVLRPGAMVGAKVLERSGAHALLLLAGAPVVASLPEGVPEGARLRLRVAAVEAERVTLQIVPEEGAGGSGASAAAGAPPAAAFALALPGGATLRLAVSEREADGGAGGRPRATAVALRYDGPALGRLDFRVAPGAIAVHASAGEPAARAAEAADALRAAVEAATGTPTQVTIHPRGETLDVHG